MGRDRRGIRLMDEPARRDLPATAQHPRRVGHRGQRAGDGVRQYGRGLRDRGRVHPQSLDRRQRILWRIPRQRAGRGRCRRHPYTAAPDDCRQEGKRFGAARDGRGDACGLRRAAPGAPNTRRPLPRHAGHRVHRRARQAVDAADPHWQAHRAGRAQDRRILRRGKPDRPRGGDPAHRTRDARAAAAPDAGPQRKNDRADARPAGLPRRRVGQGRVFRRRGGSGGEPRRAHHPGARRNQPRGHPRHARRARHSDAAGRHDQSRRRGRARHGAALRRRRRRSAHRLCGGDARGAQSHRARRRHDHDQRHDRRGHGQARCRRSSRNCRAISRP